MQGAEIFIESLLAEGVDTIFGHPGGAILPINDALYSGRIRHILTRHEQGAVHMAEGYARATGRPGVVLVTLGARRHERGHRTRRCVHGFHAHRRVHRSGAYRRYRQRCLSGSRHCRHDPLVHEAQLPRQGRQGLGPHHQRSLLHCGIRTPWTGAGRYPERRGQRLDQLQLSRRRGHSRLQADNPRSRRANPGAAAEMLAAAERPVIYSGGGVIHSEAAAELHELGELAATPVTNTLMGLGGFPGRHDLWLGMLGMHGTYTANMAHGSGPIWSSPSAPASTTGSLATLKNSASARNSSISTLIHPRSVRTFLSPCRSSVT